jgi:hypothetical protein
MTVELPPPDKVSLEHFFLTWPQLAIQYLKEKRETGKVELECDKQNDSPEAP